MDDALSSLTQEEIDRVKTCLRGLKGTLHDKHSGQSGGNAVPDEEYVYNALIHPERGDVLVTALRGKQLQVFVSNRRDPGSPFAVMDAVMARRYSGRRMLNGSFGKLKTGDFELFLITVQDKETLKNHQLQLVELYSIYFNLNDQPDSQVAGRSEEDVLKTKTLHECSNREKWEIFKANWEADKRRPIIEKELFGFLIRYARYKQPANDEILMLHPENYKQFVGQLIRDMYPYRMRLILRKEYKAEHTEVLENARVILKRLVEAVLSKKDPGNAPEYDKFLDNLVLFLRDVVNNDLEFSRFT